MLFFLWCSLPWRTNNEETQKNVEVKFFVDDVEELDLSILNLDKSLFVNYEYAKNELIKEKAYMKEAEIASEVEIGEKETKMLMFIIKEMSMCEFDDDLYNEITNII